MSNDSTEEDYINQHYGDSEWGIIMAMMMIDSEGNGVVSADNLILFRSLGRNGHDIADNTVSLSHS